MESNYVRRKALIALSASAHQGQATGVWCLLFLLLKLIVLSIDTDKLLQLCCEEDRQCPRWGRKWNTNPFPRSGDTPSTVLGGGPYAQSFWLKSRLSFSSLQRTSFLPQTTH